MEDQSQYDGPTILSRVVASSNGMVYAIGGQHGSYLSTLEEYRPSDWGQEEVLESPLWLTSTIYRASFDFTSRASRENYAVLVSNTNGSDGIEIAKYRGTPFTVDYAGAVSDSTSPSAPVVNACGSSLAGDFSASWKASDPQSSISLYHYAVGTKPGGTEVINWVNTTDTGMSRSGLGLTNGNTYYVSVQARNGGGLWSDYGYTSITAGSAVCTQNVLTLMLPFVKRP